MINRKVGDFEVFKDGILICFYSLLLVGCKDPVTLVSIEADLTTISDPYDLEEFDLTKIKIILKKVTEVKIQFPD